jgi:hypothetical protein
MKASNLLAEFAALLLTLGPSMNWGHSQPENMTIEDKSVQRLVRLDLLNLSREETSPPKRNIFTPASSAARTPAADVAAAGLSEDPFQAEQGGTPAVQAQGPPTLTVNLRYVGFVVSSDRCVALIILEGQAVAVTEGEVVAEGLRVGKITTEEIEVVLPDSSVRKYSLEGEG